MPDGSRFPESSVPSQDRDCEPAASSPLWSVRTSLPVRSNTRTDEWPDCTVSNERTSLDVKGFGETARTGYGPGPCSSPVCVTEKLTVSLATTVPSDQEFTTSSLLPRSA